MTMSPVGFPVIATTTEVVEMYRSGRMGPLWCSCIELVALMALGNLHLADPEVKPSRDAAVDMLMNAPMELLEDLFA